MTSHTPNLVYDTWLPKCGALLNYVVTQSSNENEELANWKTFKNATTVMYCGRKGCRLAASFRVGCWSFFESITGNVLMTCIPHSNMVTMAFNKKVAK